MISIVLKELEMGGHETISRVQMIGIVSEDYSVELSSFEMVSPPSVSKSLGWPHMQKHSVIREHDLQECREPMDWNDLRFILTIARAGTLSAAARRLGVNQTTVARRLAAAEAALGTRLFERVGGALHSTESGAAAVTRAARVEQEVYALKHGIGDADADAAGMVRITAVPVLVNQLLIPALSLLYTRYPRLRIELAAEPRNLSLTRREADIALRLARPKDGGSSILAKRLGHLEYAAYGPHKGAADRLPWITYEESLCHLPQARWIAKRLRGAELAPLLVSDAETLVHAIHAGLGKSLLPRFAADRDSRLRCFSGSRALVSRELWLLTHSELRHHARIAAVIAWLEEVASRALQQDGSHAAGGNSKQART